MEKGQKFDDFTPEQEEHLRLRWRSDVDTKLDFLVRSVDKLTSQVSELNEIMSIGKGGMAFLFIAAKIMAAFGVIAASVYALKAWVMR